MNDIERIKELAEHEICFKLLTEDAISGWGCFDIVHEEYIRLCCNTAPKLIAENEKMRELLKRALKELQTEAGTFTEYRDLLWDIKQFLEEV
jgi:hypothetical protein